MTDISLREYLAKLDNLLQNGAADEVIHHCRHILQYFPRHVATYQFLGRALVETGSWDRAADIFRRVLSVLPDDYNAHVGLSEIYQNLRQPDEAIWHLERALELRPNEQALMERLRELYRRHRRVEQGRIPLSAGAAARQYLRNGLYGQAIDVLREALEHLPDRVDLRLLLAQVYHEGGYRLEAGEAALDVLQVLPDCLHANRILTELWLGEQRPSDAQRYLDRIQAVDPYQALEIAQGAPAADDKFRLELLDYRRSAQRELASRAPDWLQDLDASRGVAEAAPVSDAAGDEDWMKPAAQPDEDLGDLRFDEAFSTGLPADWRTEAPPTPSVPRVSTGLTGLLAALDEPDVDVPTATETDSDRNAMPVVDAAPAPDLDTVDEMPAGDLFADLPNFPVEAAATPGAPEDHDPLAWLHASGIEVVESSQPASAGFVDDDETIAPQADMSSDPLAWLQGYGPDLLSEAAPPLSDAADIMDVDEALPGQVAFPAGSAQSAARASEDALDWLADESLLDEALHLEALTETESQLGLQDEPWDVNATDTANSLSDRQDEMTDKDEFAWMNSPDAEPEPDDQQVEPESSTPTGDETDWFSSLGGAPASEAGDEFEWLASETAEAAEEAEAEAAEVPDWLLSAAPVETGTETEAAAAPVASDEFEWLASETAEAAEEAEAEAAEMPDWLMSAAPTAAELEAEAEAAAEAAAGITGLSWLGGSESETGVTPEVEMGAPEWLASETADVAEEAEAEAAEMPDWLMSAAPTAAELEAEAEAAAEAAAGITGLGWSDSLEPEAGEVTGVEAAPASLGDEFEWLGDEAVQAAEQVEAEAAEAAPDWLLSAAPADLEPEAEASIEAAAGITSEFAWVGREEAEAAEEPESETEAGGSDWLRGIAPAGLVSEAVEDAVNAGEEFEWLQSVGEEVEIEVEDEDAVVDATAEASSAGPVDWMADMEAAAAEVEPAVEPIYDSDFEWQDEQAEPVTTEVPDWLHSIQPADAEAEPDLAEAEVVPAEPEFGWIDELQQAEEPVAMAGEADEVGYAEFEPAAPVEGDEEEALATTPAQNAPDWLNAMVPGLDVDYEAPEDEPVEQEYVEAPYHRRLDVLPEAPSTSRTREFDWLVSVVDEETRPLPPVAEEPAPRRFVFSRQPVWLREPTEQSDQPRRAGDRQEEVDDADLPSWLQ